MHSVIIDKYAEPIDWARLGVRVAGTWDDETGRDQIRDSLRQVDDDGVLVAGSLATLNMVVEGLLRTGRVDDVPVGFLLGAYSSDDAVDFAARFALPEDPEEILSAEPITLQLARTDIGGVVLQSAELARASFKPFGMQAYHDDQKIADGPVHSLRVVPDYASPGCIGASITPVGRRRGITWTFGRAVQAACDEVDFVVDGRDPIATGKRTFFVDDRTHWLLRGAVLPAPLPRPDPRRMAPPRRGLFRR